MSAFQILAISLSGSFCQKIAIPYIISKTLPPVRPLLLEAVDVDFTSTRPLLRGVKSRPSPSRPEQRNAHTQKPPNCTILPAGSVQATFSRDL